VRDWGRHYLYNCRDTSGTFEASISQRADLTERGLLAFFDDYIMRLTAPILEMCAEGFPLSLDVRDRLRVEAETQIKTLSARLLSEVGRDLNYRSPKQLLAFLHEQGVKVPKKYNKDKGSYQESTDSSSIKKIRLKHPEIGALKTIAEAKTQDTFLSRYIDFVPRSDGRLSYSLNITGTETLRFSGGTDAWDRGFNIQTIPREGGEVSIKQMFVAPEGQSFVEVDLRQAESRFVAYDSADKTLIDMLESGEDVHTYVANEILKAMGTDPVSIPRDEFKRMWRQLGKKAGHGLNYFMKANVFVETVFKELDIVITKQTAELITKVYYGIFPGIPMWHSSIRSELYAKRMLKTPFGWERYFYGRLGDDMFKEAYAFRPQSTIPWLTNSLMFGLKSLRKFMIHLLCSRPTQRLRTLAIFV
jgi:DNA polymerase I-like protein with 3'-5' exonuclease and polymerase domains